MGTPPHHDVPEGGPLQADQIAWLQGELAAVPRDVALIVALHHPIRSADAPHGCSAPEALAGRHGPQAH